MSLRYLENEPLNGLKLIVDILYDLLIEITLKKSRTIKHMHNFKMSIFEKSSVF